MLLHFFRICYGSEDYRLRTDGRTDIMDHRGSVDPIKIGTLQIVFEDDFSAFLLLFSNLKYLSKTRSTMVIAQFKTFVAKHMSTLGRFSHRKAIDTFLEL